MEILAVLAPDGADPVRAETRRSFAILDETVPPIGPLPTDRTAWEAGAADGELRQLPPARGRRPRFPTDARGNHTLPAARMDSHLRTPSPQLYARACELCRRPRPHARAPGRPLGRKPWFDWQANFSLRQRLLGRQAERVRASAELERLRTTAGTHLQDRKGHGPTRIGGGPRPRRHLRAALTGRRCGAAGELQRARRVPCRRSCTMTTLPVT